jgi:alanyl-tRNA synthetase
VRFLGYEATVAKAPVRALVVDGQRADRARKGDRVEVITAETPFYGESGGQVGDAGAIAAPQGRVRVVDAQRPVPGLVVHRGEVTEGEIALGETVELQVDEERRDRIRANHSATHLLHLALRERLGEHVKQAGSVVAPDHLRFDFSHFQPLSDEEIRDVERRVNDLVRKNEPAATSVLGMDEARKTGAMMIFGEKYGDTVRVVGIGPSKELCGGTHVRRAGDIHFFKIASEESIAAGVRRIVAHAGSGAVELAQRTDAELRQAAALLRAGAFDVASKVEGMQRRLKELEKQLSEAQGQVASARSGDLAAQAREVNGVKVLAVRAEGDGKALRELADKLREKLGRGVVALASAHDGKAVLLVAVTKDLTGILKAGDLVKDAARLIGGSGGGKPDIAQAGGADPAGIDRALERVVELVGAAAI